MKAPLIWQRFRMTIIAQLRQGVTPLALARAIAFAAVIGVFPLLGCTTLICILVGGFFRLNQPLLQAVNYLMSPLQFFMIPVFLRIGEAILRRPPTSLNPALLVTEFVASPLPFFAKYGQAGAIAVFAWALFSPGAYFLIYKATYPALERLKNGN